MSIPDIDDPLDGSVSPGAVGDGERCPGPAVGDADGCGAPALPSQAPTSPAARAAVRNY